MELWLHARPAPLCAFIKIAMQLRSERLFLSHRGLEARVRVRVGVGGSQ